MSMTKEVFQEKIEAGRTIYIGRYSCRLLDHEYWFFAEETEVFDSLEDFWCRVKPFLTRKVQDEGEQI